MSDLIKRKAAIETAYKLRHKPNDAEWAEWLKTFNAIPSADRPQGEWIKHDEERDYCSCCKHIFKTRTITKQDKWTNYIDDLGYNFCPNCGAQMKGADDE
jgi:predicted SprT family Zn-dependent metalloprotease